MRAAAGRGRGSGGLPHSPAPTAAAGTDVAAVRAAILWERNQRLARSSSSTAAAEGEAGAVGRRELRPGADLGRASPCRPRLERRGREGRRRSGGRGEGRGEAGPGTGSVVGAEAEAR